MGNNTNGNERDLSEYRIKQARECLYAAETVLKTSAKNAVNRTYYCIFHAIRAILALEHFDSKKHSGVISAFRQRYIKTGVFDVSLSLIIGSAFEIRNESDYEDFVEISESQAMQQIENAKVFLEAVETYLDAHFTAPDV